VDSNRDSRIAIHQILAAAPEINFMLSHLKTMPFSREWKSVKMAHLVQNLCRGIPNNNKKNSALHPEITIDFSYLQSI